LIGKSELSLLDTPLEQLVLSIGESEYEEILAEVLVLIDDDVCGADGAEDFLIVEGFEFVLLLGRLIWEAAVELDGAGFAEE
jgi:hypothetical protein